MPLTMQANKVKLLKDQVQKIIASGGFEAQRNLVNSIAAELKIPTLDCAVAIIHLYEHNPGMAVPETVGQTSGEKRHGHDKPTRHPGIRLVRYRLDLGSQHNVEPDEIKKVMVEESGVDIKNISNVRIMDSYTLVDLPDEMPQEIFHHLKEIEIKGKKLDIRRVKPRNKKRGNRKNRRCKTSPYPTAKENSHS